MNPLDDQLARLFRSASRGGDRPVASPAFGLETRVLAAWRAFESPSAWSTGVLVRGLVLASLIMGVSLWTALEQKGNSDADYLRLADSTAQTDYP